MRGVPAHMRGALVRTATRRARAPGALPCPPIRGLAQAVDPNQVLGLYREILKAAKRFPSIKRDGMVEEIRREFRQNASETDEEARSKQLEVAVTSLGQLRAFTNLDSRAGNWAVKMQSAPMPKPDRGEES